MSYGMYFRINGGRESGGGKRRREQGGGRRERKEQGCGEEEGDRKRAVREEFETLSRRERGKERPMVTGPRETESAPAYNLKTHSAFKLLTIAAGYKVLCRYHGEREARRGSRGLQEGRARFKSLIYLRGDCGRHDDATARGRSGADFRWGVRQKKRDRRTERRISLPAFRRPRHVWHFSSFRSSASLDDSAGSNRVIME